MKATAWIGFVLLTSIAYGLVFPGVSEASYISVLFGTDSEAKGNYAVQATALDAALKNWTNWQVANAAGTMMLVGSDRTITQALTSLSNVASAPSDFVLFLYYGHGGKVGNNVEGNPALDPSDERLSTFKNASGWTRETDDSVANAFDALKKDAYKLAIFITCYAGGMWGEPAFDLNKVPNAFMYGSSKETQLTPDPDPFFAALVSSMADKSADLNHDRKVTVGEWFTRAKTIVALSNATFFYPNQKNLDDLDGPPQDVTAEPVYLADSSFFDSLVVAQDIPAPSSLVLLGVGIGVMSLGKTRIAGLFRTARWGTHRAETSH